MLIVFIGLEAGGVVLAEVKPGGAPVYIAPALMTIALVAFMVWLYVESRRTHRG